MDCADIVPRPMNDAPTVPSGTRAFLSGALAHARRTQTLKAFYKHDGSVSMSKCAPSHTVGETEA